MSTQQAQAVVGAGASFGSGTFWKSEPEPERHKIVSAPQPCSQGWSWQKHFTTVERSSMCSVYLYKVGTGLQVPRFYLKPDKLSRSAAMYSTAQVMTVYGSTWRALRDKHQHKIIDNRSVNLSKFGTENWGTYPSYHCRMLVYLYYSKLVSTANQHIKIRQNEINFQTTWLKCNEFV